MINSFKRILAITEMSLTVCLPQLFSPRDIDQLSNYMMTAERWNKIDILSRSYKPSVIDVTEIPEEQLVQHNYTSPKEEEPTAEYTFQDKLEKFTLNTKGSIDGLFWSMYLAHYGMNEYIRVGLNNGNEEMKEKNKITEYLHTQPITVLKAFSNYKITKAFITDAISDLLTCGKMKWSGLIAMSLFYQANILIVDYEKKIYLPFLVGNALQTYILYRNPLYNKKDRKSVSYFVDVAEKLMKIEEISNTMIGLLHYEKPLKGISTYKSSDLETMAEKLGIELDDENGKMLKKQDLYTKILLKCVWE